MLNIDTRTADKKRPIPLFVEQSQFEQFTPTHQKILFKTFKECLGENPSLILLLKIKANNGLLT
jgi:hypothetical protein